MKNKGFYIISATIICILFVISIVIMHSEINKIKKENSEIKVEFSKTNAFIIETIRESLKFKPKYKKGDKVCYIAHVGKNITIEKHEITQIEYDITTIPILSIYYNPYNIGAEKTIEIKAIYTTEAGIRLGDEDIVNCNICQEGNK